MIVKLCCLYPLNKCDLNAVTGDLSSCPCSSVYTELGARSSASYTQTQLKVTAGRRTLENNQAAIFSLSPCIVLQNNVLYWYTAARSEDKETNDTKYLSVKK